jgi:diadenosine tetraphosphate (Ap4A) HIT family hydrolase
MLIVGDEVPHVHLHIVPFDSAGELSFAKADPNPPEGSLAAAAQKIRAALRDLGADSVSE